MKSPLPVKPCEGVPGVYARTDGVIFSTKRSGHQKLLTKTIRGASATVKVQSCDGRGRCSPTVGSLVLRAFVGKPPTPKHKTLHLDCDSHNDELSNLKWATPREIHQHRIAFATQSFEGAGAIDDVTTIARRIRNGEDHLALAREYKIAPGCINWLASMMGLLAFQRMKTRAA